MTAVYVETRPPTGPRADRPNGRANAHRRHELAAFLRARRARLTPQDVGLPPGLRRRTAGLRREEVAQLAGVGVTWYTWLEQGRPINASTQVLDAVARTLRLDDAEREHLYRLTGNHVLPTASEIGSVPESVIEIVKSLEPLPAFLINARYDVLAYNDAYRALVRDWHTIPCERRNVLWCCFTEPSVRERFVNFDTEAPRIVATLRASYAQHLHEPAWDEFIHRLSARSPEFAEMWARHEVAQIGAAGIKHFRHPVAGDLLLTATSLAVSDLPDHRVVVYTPSDDETRRRLPLTLGSNGLLPLA